MTHSKPTAQNSPAVLAIDVAVKQAGRTRLVRLGHPEDIAELLALLERLRVRDAA